MLTRELKSGLKDQQQQASMLKNHGATAGAVLNTEPLLIAGREQAHPWMMLHPAEKAYF